MNRLQKTDGRRVPIFLIADLAAKTPRVKIWAVPVKQSDHYARYAGKEKIKYETR